MPDIQQDVWDVDLVPINVATSESGNPVYRAQLRNSRIVYDVEKIVKALEREKIAIDRDMALWIIHRFIEKAKELILQGYAIRLDDLVKIWGKVEGSFEGVDAFYVAEHKKTVAVGNYAAFNKELDHVKVEVVSTHQPGSTALIYGIEDKATGRTDNYVTPGDNIIIRGEKIKVVGEPQGDPKVLEEGIGVFFVPLNGDDPIEATRIDSNGPTTLEVRVPATLPVNSEFELAIVTRYSSGNTLLKEPRVLYAPSHVNTLIVTPTPIEDEDDDEDVIIAEYPDDDDEEILVTVEGPDDDDDYDDEEIIAEDPDDDEEEEDFFVDLIGPDDDDDDFDINNIVEEDDDEEIIAEDLDEDEEEIIAEDPSDEEEEEEIEVIYEDDDDDDDIPPKKPIKAAVKVSPAKVAVKVAPAKVKTVKVEAEEDDDDDDEEVPVKVTPKVQPAKVVTSKVAPAAKPAPSVQPAPVVKPVSKASDKKAQPVSFLKAVRNKAKKGFL